ncbi:MAG: hypothetical protein ACREUL_17795 [Steroidobacteraceae bacterium]
MILLGKLGTTFAISGSEITAANDTWVPYQQTLQLEALKLGSSNWFARMRCISAAPQAAA